MGLTHSEPHSFLAWVMKCGILELMLEQMKTFGDNRIRRMCFAPGIDVNFGVELEAGLQWVEWGRE